MLPNVVLPALLEVEDGDWTYTVAVTITGEDDGEDSIRPESNRSKDELRSVGGYVFQKPQIAEGLRTTARDNECHSWRPRHRSHSRSPYSKSSKGEKGKGRYFGPLAGPAHEGSSNGGPATPLSSKLLRSGPSAKKIMPKVHPQESSKLKGSSVSARRKARSWPPRLKEASSTLKRNLERGGSSEANRDTFRGKSLSSKSDLSPGSETSKVFIGETEGDEGISQCKLVNKPFSSFPVRVKLFRSTWFLFYLSCCGSQPSWWETLSNPEERSVSGEASSPELEPSTLPLEGFQVEGLTPRKIVKVQSVLESLRIRIVRDNGKGVEGENKNLKLEYKRIRFQEENEDCEKVFKYSKPRCCDTSGNKESNLGQEFKCTEKVLGSFSVTVKLNSDEEGSFWLTSVRISEKMGDSRLTVNMRCFDEFIRESGLLDPPLRNAAFTSFQEALPRWTSDHSPICLETNPLKWGPTPFRFENMWLLHPEFKEKFRDWWQECTVEGWEVTSRIDLIDLIEQERNLNLDLVSERTLRRKELEDLLLKEEVQWKQKSRVKRIKEGDCNSKFFHRVATGRRSRKFIKSLISERGETLSNIEVIYEEIVNFFGKLYSKPEGVDAKFFMNNLWLSRSFVEGRHILDAVLIANEVVDEKRRKGFSQKWRSWMRGCLSSSSFAILVNGNAKGWVKASRVSIASKIEKMQRDFFGLGWGKEERSPYQMEGKWLWRFPRERSGLWHKVIASIYGTHPNGWDANTVVKWSHRCPWKAIAQVFQEVISVKNLIVSNVLGNSLPMSWNFNFHHNLTDSEIDLLQRLMSSLSSVLFSPSSLDSRAWSLSSSGPRLVSSTWKVNTNDKFAIEKTLQSPLSSMVHSLQGNGESIDHIFLHCPVTIGLWHRLFNLVGLVWVPPRSLEDMLVITFKGLGNSLEARHFGQIACLTLIWMVWQERNNRIFEDKGRTEEMVWDLIRFYSSL
ncbi:hypothetical protein CK203_088908 [Vitis vinifera]|uniref:Reverse transcriptase zinc-binding domain-containing protein n=1 Tax=Vitis vinifera TaxID=29760 RepID=A0A438D0S5_VITVI|nr:hypothetical protein CK203_088908 [Vitis vinifera]